MATPQARHSATSRRFSRRAKILISVATGLAVIIAGTGMAALVVRHQIDAKINHVDIAFPVAPDAPSPSTEARDIGTKAPINFLMLGSDSSSGGGDPTDWKIGGQRSDVMMLVQISGDRQSVSVASIPRDSWVPIEGYGDAKINAAFSYGGPELAISTVQNLTGVTIDHFAIIDFISFEKLTDELGGVTVKTSKGDQRMSGDDALAFVRERHSLPQGDFDRVRRQQAWIQAILSEVFKKDALKSPTKIASLINIVLDYSAVDQAINFDYMASLAVEAKSLRPGGVKFMTVPYSGTGRSPDGKQSIVVLDKPKLDALMEAWRDDDVAKYVATHPDAVPALGDRPVS
jgi:LCP family protein required for cell wall assembly